LPLLLLERLRCEAEEEEEAEEVTKRRLLRVGEEEETKPVLPRPGKLRSMMVSPLSPAVAMIDRSSKGQLV